MLRHRCSGTAQQLQAQGEEVAGGLGAAWPPLLIFVKPRVSNFVSRFGAENCASEALQSCFHASVLEPCAAVHQGWTGGIGVSWGPRVRSHVGLLPQSMAAGDVPAFRKCIAGPELPLWACSMLETKQGSSLAITKPH